MADNTITQEEIENLLKMIKESLVASISFPNKGKKESFEVKSISSRDMFDIHIYRGAINDNKMSIAAIIEKNHIPLLELHINPSNKHYNLDGTVFVGSHWHIYSEKFGRSLIIPATDIEDDSFVQKTVLFLDKFNVIKKPDIQVQLELI